MATRPKAKGPQVAKLIQYGSSFKLGPNGEWIWTNVPPPIEVARAGKIAWRSIWCAGYDVGEDGKKRYHHLECLPCHCAPGPHKRALFTTAREVALLGTRGSGKSEETFEFLTTGNCPMDLDALKPNYDTANPLPVDTTYLTCPDYAFLVLRRNSKDLLSYFKRASRYFANFGGEMTQEPMGVRFPSGAFGVFDHLADEGAYEKYVGAEFVRIVVEEANQIPDEKLYLKIKASCRTSNPHMHAQLQLTYNPGGPGARWLKSRFIMPGGKRQPFGKTYTDPYSGQTRVAIFSSVEDNPYMMAAGYDKELDALRADDPTLYKQWRLGDFDTQQGQFFDTLRVQRLAHEPENACHTVKPHKLPGDWPVAIGCDWGYRHPAAVYWGKWSPKKQLHVYRELVVSRMAAKDLGVEIAKRSLDDLAEAPNPKFNLYLSHDAFHREHEGSTEADLIRSGIESVLGKDAAFVYDRTEEELLLDKDVSWESVKRRHAEKRHKTYVTVINAGLKRRGNMNLIRDYLRWWQMETEEAVFKPEIYQNLLAIEGEHSAQEYVKKCKPKPPEVLPILQIHYDEDALDVRDRGCVELIKSMQAMIEKESDKEQMEKLEDVDDSTDALAYLVGNFPFQRGFMSDEDQLRQKIKAIREKNPSIDTNSLIRNAERIEAKHARSNGGRGFSVSRVVRPMQHRLRAGMR